MLYETHEGTLSMRDHYLNALMSQIEARLSRLEWRDQKITDDQDDRLLRRVRQQLERIMATLAEALELIKSNDDRLDSINALIVQLREQIAQIPGLTPEQQAQIDAIMTEAQESKAKIDAALNTNVPAPPVEPNTPPEEVVLPST